jgi:Tfp pilus assembly protein PilF
MLYREEGRQNEAEDQWRQALAAQPDYLPAWEGLAELCLDRRDWSGLEKVSDEAALVFRQSTASVFRARGHMARKEFVQARKVLQDLIENQPKSLQPRLLMAYTWLQEDRDLDAAEQALRDVLALEPNHAETRQNLMRLARRRDKTTNGRPHRQVQS